MQSQNVPGKAQGEGENWTIWQAVLATRGKSWNLENQKRKEIG